MINFCFFLTAALGLIVSQTILLPSFAWFPYSFDLLIVLVLYLSLAYTHYGAVLAIAALGVIMDSVSGVPFFFHLFAYLWVYIVVQLLKQVVFQRSLPFMVAVSLIAVMVQQVMALFIVFLDHGEEGLLNADFSELAWQLVLGGLLIPAGIGLLSLLQDNTKYIIGQIQRELDRRYRD